VLLTAARRSVGVVAGDRSEPSKGIHYCISEDSGKTWDASSTVTLLPDTFVVGRYYQPKLIQIDEETLGTVFMKGPQGEMDGIFYMTVPLESIDSAAAVEEEPTS
jgi:hypothetical protein